MMKKIRRSFDFFKEITVICDLFEKTRKNIQKCHEFAR